MIIWNRISHALEYYKGHGYLPLEGSWIVPTAINKMVGQPSIQFKNEEGLSIASSGEGIFLKAYADGKILKHRYVICAPFFALGLECGIHIQLFRTDIIGASALYNMIEDAELLYRGIHPDKKEIFRVSTSPGISLVCDNAVIGTYGVRKVGDLSWIYGTGLIETI